MKANRYLKGTHIGTAKIINSAAVRLPELERDSRYRDDGNDLRRLQAWIDEKRQGKEWAA